jgi:predicted metal-dependent RNase
MIPWNPDPAVIVASSGMLAGGPSLGYAQNLACKSLGKTQLN